MGMGKLLLLSLGLVLLVVLSAEAGNNKGQNRVQSGGNGKRAGQKGRAAAKRKFGRRNRKRERKNQTKKKKRNKNKKKNKQARKKASRKSQTRSDCRQTSTFCPAEKALALKMLYAQVANFFRQLKRAENHAKIISKKKEKKDNFESDAAILQDAVGGNISAPVCASGRRSAS